MKGFRAFLLRGNVVDLAVGIVIGAAFTTVVNKLVAARPDAVFNTLNGDSNVAFFKQLRSAGMTPDKKLAWVLQDWKNLGPATTVQLLDEPGIPENPGDLQR